MLVIAGNDLRRRMRDRTFYIQGIVAPLAMATIIGLAFGGGFSFKATIGVADGDGSDMSRALVEQLVAATEKGSPVTFKRIDAGDAHKRVESGAVDAVIDGKAAYNVMGDWAVAEFTAKAGLDMVHVP